MKVKWIQKNHDFDKKCTQGGIPEASYVLLTAAGNWRSAKRTSLRYITDYLLTTANWQSAFSRHVESAGTRDNAGFVSLTPLYTPQTVTGLITQITVT